MTTFVSTAKSAIDMLEEMDANNAAFAVVRTKVESRLIPFATPSELVKMTSILRANKKLLVKLHTSMTTMEAEVYN